MTHPENVKAIIRLRPFLLPNSSSQRTNLVVQPENASVMAGGTWFTFDAVHAHTHSTHQIYDNHFASMICDSVEGYNSTLFAYGATGTGKSFSMIGSDREDGIMQRAIHDIFDLIEQDQEREYVVRTSYLEIYNEQIRDLLASELISPTSTSTSSFAINNPIAPRIHEDRQGRIFVRPLVSTPCANPQDVMKLLLYGESKRRVERTEWNLNSSRSHTIFSLTLESRPVIHPTSFPITSNTIRQLMPHRQTPPIPMACATDSLDPNSLPSQPSTSSSFEVFLGTGSGKMPITPSVTRFQSSTASSKSSHHIPDGSIRISQLNLVDLAGSEKLTDNEARNKEASYIKKSLLALQSVVSSLTELGTSTSSSNQSNTSSSNQSSNTSNPSNNKQKLLHVPYRNSQLTRLLQTSLSGNAKVAFLCTISPEPESDVETLSTLRFAAAAKKVETRAEMGQVVDRATLLEALESKVLELEAALMTNADYTEALERERDEAIERADGAEKTCDDYETKLAELQTLRTPLKEQHDHLKRLILTGSPRSSYANPNALDLHTTNLTPTLIRRKSVGTKRHSRLSEAAASISSPTTTKVDWKELFFDAKHTNETKNKQTTPDMDSMDNCEKINELTLTVAKLEATLTEAEETHLGEISELRSEISALEDQVRQLQQALHERDQQLVASSNKRSPEQNTDNEIETPRRTPDYKVHVRIEPLDLMKPPSHNIRAYNPHQ